MTRQIHATLAGYGNLNGVNICCQHELHQDEEGLYACISFYELGTPEKERKRTIVRAGCVAPWAAVFPEWFEIICSGGLHMSLGIELIPLEMAKDPTYKEAYQNFLDEFTRVAEERGLFFSGMGIGYVVPKGQKPQTLWQCLLNLIGFRH